MFKQADTELASNGICVNLLKGDAIRDGAPLEVSA